MSSVVETPASAEEGAPSDGFDSFLRAVARVSDASMASGDEAVPAPRLEAGARLDERLVLRRPIGRGGMGWVWLAHHERLEIDVAVKFVALRHGGRGKRARRRFAREAKLAARVQSPHVVRVFDHGEAADGTPFLVMELLKGETLRHRMRDGPLPVDDVVALTREAAQGLEAVHALGIVHRDIKPENIFLCEGRGGSHLKLLDFGVASEGVGEFGRMTETGALLGTPSYMGPEQLLEARAADGRSDQWALAVVAYEALTGELPYRGKTVAAMGRAFGEGRFTPPSRLRPVSHAVDRCFAQALALDPDGRHDSALAFADDLERALRRPVRPRWPWALAGAATIVGLVSWRGGAERAVRLDPWTEVEPVVSAAVAGSSVPAPTARASTHPAPAAASAPPPLPGPRRAPRSPMGPAASPAAPKPPPMAAPADPGDGLPAFCHDDVRAFVDDGEGRLRLRPECRR